MSYMKRKILFLSLIVVAGFGCTKPESASQPNSNNNGFPINPNGGGGGGGGGTTSACGTGEAMADLAIDSVSTLAAYTGRPMNNPTETKICVALTKNAGTGLYEGNMKIAYKDAGTACDSMPNQRCVGNFTTGTGKDWNNRDNATYDHFYVHDRQYFKAFLSDSGGAIIFLVDQVDDLGLSGKVYFKNYGSTLAPPPPSRCWFVEIGPYACQDFLVGGSVRPDQVVYPSIFTRLGTFFGLTRAVALKQ